MKTQLLINSLLICALAYGQNLDQIGKSPLLKVNGGVSANSVFYSGTANREPLTYFLSGNLNINISGVYNIPLSFSYTNQDFNYSTPFRINRLSLHPTYKWVATHIGDAAMTFSPYTVSGHQFTGFGTDLNPNKPWKFSTFYGRLLQASEYDPETHEAIPAFERMGFGMKAQYDFKKFNLGVIFFKAKDDENSLEVPIPTELNITPKENVVVSINSSVPLTKQLSFNLEVAQSAVTEDITDDTPAESSHPLDAFLNAKGSTDYYTALKADVSYSFAKGNVGVAIERIDPQYRTFGAYFFNNDLENITINAAQELFNGTVSLSVNAGLQRDDLKNEKESKSNRVVSALNANIRASEKLNITTSYSNFQSFTNLRTVFDDINQPDQPENIEFLDFKQIAQNAALNLRYQLSQKKTKPQNLGINFTYQSTKDDQGNAENNTSTNFYNAGANYAISYPEQSMALNGSINAAYNTLQGTNALTYGPTVSISKQFFEKKLRTGFSASFNESLTNGTSQGNNTNLRANSSYVYKEKHNLNLNAVAQFRNTPNSGGTNDFTVTFGYSYSFDVKKPEIRFPDRTSKETIPKQKKEQPHKNSKTKAPKQNYYRFRYRETIYEGPAFQVVNQIESSSQKEFLNDNPSFDGQKLGDQFADLKVSARQDDKFKEKALDYLDSIFLRKDFIPIYERSLKTVLYRLQKELMYKNEQLRNQFAQAKDDMEAHPLHQLNQNERNQADEKEQFEYMKLQTKHKVDGEKLEQYLFVIIEIDKALRNEKTLKKEIHSINIRGNTQSKAFTIYLLKKDTQKVLQYLEGEIIKYYDDLYQED